MCALLASLKEPKKVKTTKNEDFTRIVYLVNYTILYYTVPYHTTHTYIGVLLGALGYYFPVLLGYHFTQGDSLSCR